MSRLCRRELFWEENLEGEAALEEVRPRRGMVAVFVLGQTGGGRPKKIGSTIVLYYRHETVSGGELLWHERASTMTM